MYVTASNIERLMELQRGVLSETGGKSSQRALGNLSGFYVGPRGWHADGPARARVFLVRALAEYLKTESAPPPIGFSRKHKAAALRLYLGISAPPLSAQKAADRLGRVDDVTEPPSDSSVYLWRNQFASDPAVLAEADRTYLSDDRLRIEITSDQADVLETLRPVWRGTRSAWPPPRTWPPEQLDGAAERAALVAATKRLFAHEVGDDEAIQLLREVVADEMLDSYFGHEDWSRQYRHALTKMVEPWFALDDFYFREPEPEPDSPVATTGFARQVAAIVQMLFHDAAGVGSLSQTLSVTATERARARGMNTLASTAQLADRIGPDERPLTEAERRTRRRFLAAAGGDVEISKSRTYVVNDGDWSETKKIAALFEKSTLIRTSSGHAAVKLAQDYITERATVQWNDVDLADAITLELADQSVSLDVARFNDPILVSRLAALVRSAAPTPQGAAYLTLVHRDESLIHTKRGRSRSAIASIFRGFSDLRYLQDNGQVEFKAAQEAGHQLALRGAGAYVQIVEARLRSSPEKQLHDPRLQRWTRNALLLSHETRLRLDELEFSNHGLSSRRHEDGHISSTAWRVQTQVINLRVRLAAHTAVFSELCAKPVPPAGPRAASAFDLRLIEIGKLYHALISTREVGPADINDIVKLGMWFALLNDGRLPLAADLAPALKDLSFIDGDPDVLSENFMQYRDVDLIASSSWLASRGHDSGILSYLPSAGPVFQLLKSGTLLAEWREEFPQITKASREREKEHSHAEERAGRSPEMLIL